MFSYVKISKHHHCDLRCENSQVTQTSGHTCAWEALPPGMPWPLRPQWMSPTLRWISCVPVAICLVQVSIGRSSKYLQLLSQVIIGWFINVTHLVPQQESNTEILERECACLASTSPLPTENGISTSVTPRLVTRSWEQPQLALALGWPVAFVFRVH